MFFRMAHAILFCIAAAPTWAETSPQVQAKSVLSIYADLDVMCRGSSGDATDQACTTRNKVSSLLKSMGYCYASPQSGWRHC